MLVWYGCCIFLKQRASVHSVVVDLQQLVRVPLILHVYSNAVFKTKPSFLCTSQFVPILCPGTFMLKLDAFQI